jgi:hypothetical protein
MIAKFPYQLSESEWNRRREAIRPGHCLSRATRKDKSEAIRNGREIEWLVYGVRDEEQAELAAAMRGDIEITTARAQELAGIIAEPVLYRDVIEKAKREGKI